MHFTPSIYRQVMLFPLRKLWKVKIEFYNLFQRMFADTQSSRLFLNGIAAALQNTKAIFIVGKNVHFLKHNVLAKDHSLLRYSGCGMLGFVLCLPQDRWRLQGQVSLRAHKLCAQGACCCVTCCPQ